MAENQAQNLQSAQVIAKIFGVTTAEVETLRKKKIITGSGSPKKYDLLPTIQDYFRYLHDSTRYMTAAELSDVFGVTTRRVEQLKSEGVIKGEGKPTKYDFIETVKAYIGYLADKAYGREQKETMSNLEEAKLSAEVEIKQAKAKAAQMELKELQGKLHRAEDVEAITTDHVLFLRSMLMAMPGKLAVDLSGTHNAAEQAERVKQEVYFILNNLAEYKYDPEEYKKRVMERQGWKNRREDDGDDAD